MMRSGVIYIGPFSTYQTRFLTLKV